MVTIYSIKADVNQYQHLIPCDLQNVDGLVMNGLKKEDWNSMDFYVANPANKRGSFSSVIGCSFAIDSHFLANEIISNMLAICSDLLPIRCENGEVLHIVNVTQCVSALDVEKTVRKKSWDSIRNVPAWGRILQYAFHAQRLNRAPLFKIPEEINASIFTHHGILSKEDDFYSVYHKFGLTGLIFEKVWESQ